jgi:hypothetical protein
MQKGSRVNTPYPRIQPLLDRKYSEKNYPCTKHVQTVFFLSLLPKLYDIITIYNVFGIISNLEMF